MKRIIAAVLLSAFAAANIIAQTNTQPAAPDPKDTAKDAAKDATTSPGVRKLSRRERKDKIAKLGDKYREFLADVEPIMLPTELDTFLVLETDPQRDIYINDFWHRRDQSQGTTNRAFRDAYYARLEGAKEKFRNMSSDRGRMYLIQGEPLEILESDCERYLQPVQIWKYDEVPGLGHNVRFLFYIPRNGNDYKLWDPSMLSAQRDALGELVSTRSTVGSMTTEGAVQKAFYDSASGKQFLSNVEFECKYGDEILRAISQMQMNKTDLPKVFDPPPVKEEDVRKILRSVVIANPNAPKLAAEFSVRFPAKQGSRTDAEITLLVPRSQLTPKDVNGSLIYSIDVTGEMLKDAALFDNFRYRFDFPGDTKEEKLPVVLERFLFPNDYTARLKVLDVHSGAEAIVENTLKVPEIFDTPEQLKQKANAEQTVAQLKEEIDSNETRLRIVPLADDLLSGLQHIETIAFGTNIKQVEFYLDGKKIMVKRQPPYTLDLDFGEVPQLRKIKAVALDGAGNILSGDEIVVNTGTDPFRVRIKSPRVAPKVAGRTRVEITAGVPEGKELEHVELFLNETKMATMYNPPFIQTINIPETQGVGYLRAVAKLKDDSSPAVEDVVMINTPDFMETLDVHLIELPTTVLVGGRPKNDLAQGSFKVLDEGKPVKIAKFEHVKNLPLSIGLAIDTSGSMQPRMSEAQKAGAKFFQSVMKHGDKAFLVAFDSQPQLVQKWSARVADVNAGLAKLRAEDYTALYDAVVYSLYNFLGVKGQKALVLISDGKDTASKFSFDQAIEYARRSSVPIYAIGLGIRQTEQDVRYKLGKLAGETGGNVYYIDNAGQLGKIYEDIQAELRSQYVIGFYPPEGVKAGSKWREVTVQVSEGKAKTIRGYYP